VQTKVNHIPTNKLLLHVASSVAIFGSMGSIEQNQLIPRNDPVATYSKDETSDC
jgi:hypothetical protein